MSTSSNDPSKCLRGIVEQIDGVQLRRGDLSTAVTSLSEDSRRVEPGGLFVALRGEQFDGHRFVDEAIEAGASALLVQRDYRPPGGIPGQVAVLESENTRRSLGLVASWFFDHPSRCLDVIGVTGTNGKTSTSYLLESIFRRSEKATGIIGTVEYRWPGHRQTAPNTTPNGLVLQRTLRQMVDQGVQVAIVEVSSHGLALGRVAGTRFRCGVFTNLSRDHLNFHESFDAYRRAKWRLFDEYLPASANAATGRPVAVINTDDPEGQRLFDHLASREQLLVASHSIGQPRCPEANHHYRGKQVDTGIEGVSLTLQEPAGQHYELSVGLPGRFNADNALGAAAVARVLGVKRRHVVEGLADCPGVPGRMQRVGADVEGPAVFVDYAHTPDALQKALEALRADTAGQLWVVFGAGGDRDRSKRAPMGEVAGRLADRVVLTSDNPRSEPPDQIIDDIREGLERFEDRREIAEWSREQSRRTAIEEAILQASRTDVILIAGKGHETSQEQDGRRCRFDDRRVALEALRRRGVQECGD